MPSPPLVIPRPSGHPPLRIIPTAGKLSITPASLLCLDVLDRHEELLAGDGIDWGSGSGILAVAAATIPGVDSVVGLELEAADVTTARTNAELNGVADRVTFVRADAFDPFPDEDAAALHALRSRVGFLLANPPASIGDDGLEWRRVVLYGARGYLRTGAPVLLQISRQYGSVRIEGLAGDGYTYHGLLGSSGWVPFDQERDDLARALRDYAEEEARTGILYPFRDAERDEEIDARTALWRWEHGGVSPRSQWQLHRFEWTGK